VPCEHRLDKIYLLLAVEPSKIGAIYSQILFEKDARTGMIWCKENSNQSLHFKSKKWASFFDLKWLKTNEDRYR
jgi:hypothetical protein